MGRAGRRVHQAKGRARGQCGWSVMAGAGSGKGLAHISLNLEGVWDRFFKSHGKHKESVGRKTRSWGLRGQWHG